MTPPPPQVYKAICDVAAALAAEGIGKERKNETQGFRFRGIDDVYNALAPLLAKHRLCMLPRVTERLQSERTTKSGTVLYSVTVFMEFDFVSSEDGSKHTIATVGEAMDSGDKATNKAMSAAYKYAAFMAFAIPTEGSDDADATTPATKPKAPADPPVVAKGHHPSFTEKVAQSFVLALSNLKPSVQYNALAKWLEGDTEQASKLRDQLGVPPSRPSAWDKTLRDKLFKKVAAHPDAFVLAFEQGSTHGD